MVLNQILIPNNIWLLALIPAPYVVFSLRSGPITEGFGCSAADQTTEGRGQKTDDRGQKSEVREQRSDDG
jgi:hypothetical protein